MAKILAKKQVADNCFEIELSAPLIAQNGRAGQFVILRINEEGERFPLTLVRQDPKKGTISIIAQVIGKSTAQLTALNIGEEILDIAGPLGNSTEVKKFGTVVVIGGGVGIAEILPIAKALKAAGNKIISILGARSENLLMLEAEMQAISDAIFITTDDGSSGQKGLVTSPLKTIMDSAKVDYVFAVGPLPMMRAVADTTREAGIKTVVSLNPIFIDATGMCGVCRVTIGGKIKFGCFHGPEFDAHAIDFAELAQRNRTYLTQEKESYDMFRHACGKEKHCG